MITVINQIKGKIGNNNTQKGHDTSDISSCVMFTVINVRRVTRCSREKWLSKHFKIYIMKIVVLFVYYLCLSKIFTKTLRMCLFFFNQLIILLVRCFQLFMMSHLLKNIVWFICYMVSGEKKLIYRWDFFIIFVLREIFKSEEPWWEKLNNVDKMQKYC